MRAYFSLIFVLGFLTSTILSANSLVNKLKDYRTNWHAYTPQAEVFNNEVVDEDRLNRESRDIVAKFTKNPSLVCKLDLGVFRDFLYIFNRVFLLHGTDCDVSDAWSDFVEQNEKEISLLLKVAIRKQEETLREMSREDISAEKFYLFLRHESEITYVLQSLSNLSLVSQMTLAELPLIRIMILVHLLQSRHRSAAEIIADLDGRSMQFGPEQAYHQGASIAKRWAKHITENADGLARFSTQFAPFANEWITLIGITDSWLARSGEGGDRDDKSLLKALFSYLGTDFSDPISLLQLTPKEDMSAYLGLVELLARD